MKFKARFIVESEVEVAADNVDTAAKVLRAGLHRDWGKGYKLLGLIPADQQWPDTVEQRRPLPPRGGGPNGGSPGTPIARLDEQPVSAVAA